MKFDELTAGAVSKLPNEELLSLHFRCHQLASGEFCERALEVHDEIIAPDMAKRRIKHTSPLKCHNEKSLKPPSDVVKAARRGLELYEAGHGGEGLEKETVEWARRVAKGEPVTRAKAEQGYRWHARNARFAKAPDESPMGTAWWLWFGKAGKRWFVELWGEKGRGLYLVEPHGELIAQGRSKAIAKDRRLDLEGEWILVSDEFAWGGMIVGEPEKVGLEDFDGRYGEEHHIGKKERLQWWPLAEDLWLYPIESFEPYEQPKRVVVPPGTQTVMKGVEFAEKARSDDVIKKLDSIPDKFVWIPDFVSVTGSTIYAKDREPHDIDVVLRAESDGDGYAIKLPVDAGFAIKLERVLEDALDGKSVQYVPSNYGPNWTSLSLYDLCLVKREPLELMEIGEREPEFVEMEYKAVGEKGSPSRSRCMECDESPEVDVHWADGRARAWFCLPHFKQWIKEDDLEVVRAWFVEDGKVPEKLNDHLRKNQVLTLGSDVTASQILERIEQLKKERRGKKSLSKSALDRKLRGASEEIKRQAYQTWQEDAVKPGRMVLSLKPMRPAPAGERQTASQFYKYIEENLEFPLYLSAKRDGGTVYASGDGKGKVWLFSDDGEDVTEKLPNLVEALKRNFGSKSFYVGSEIEYWKDGNHFPREAAVGAIKRGDDENLAMNIFRVVYWDGDDLHKKPFSEAWGIAQELPVDTKSDGALYPRKNGPINLVPHYKVDSISALKERLEKVAYKPGVEGVVVKRADGGFPLDGEPDSQNPEEIKFHKSFAAKYVCLGQNETATAGVYTTWLGLPIEK